MFFQYCPLKILYPEFARRVTEQQLTYLVAQAENRKNGDWRVNPGTGDAGEFVQSENERRGNSHGRVNAEKGGKADENPHGKAGGDMARMAVKRENLSETFFPALFVKQADSPEGNEWRV